MGGVNWWLMGIAFALGVALTLAFTLRRVTREVPAREGAKAAENETPYGEGSVRIAPGAQPPSGWSVKGDEEAMSYHSTDSPDYDGTVAEIWFRDVATAEAAGFHRWDSGTTERGAG